MIFITLTCPLFIDPTKDKDQVKSEKKKTGRLDIGVVGGPQNIPCIYFNLIIIKQDTDQNEGTRDRVVYRPGRMNKVQIYGVKEK